MRKLFRTILRLRSISTGAAKRAEAEMSSGALHSERGRELLSQRIFEVLDSWPETCRIVFIRSHYWGDTAEMISASMDMRPADVSQMLERCDQMLLAALRPFREEAGDPDQAGRERLTVPPRDLYC
jgi:DNA-directed RNA polymerase specialized sigma24 family protein